MPIDKPAAAASPPTCLLLRPGLVEYQEAWGMQRALAAAVRAGTLEDSLLLLEHPHVYTLGRNADAANVLVDDLTLSRLGATLVRIDRGGDVTYHGPGQIVGYPVVDLRKRGSDVHRYVREIEETLILTLADLGIAAHRLQGLPGVWVGNDKVAAIGVRIAHWITGHGFALNVGTDLTYFEHIIPCGLRDRGVASVSSILERAVEVGEVLPVVERRFAQVFGCSFIVVDDPRAMLSSLPN